MEFRGFSESSERLQPQVVLHTISDDGLWFKLAPEEGCEASWHELDLIHSSCVTDSKTAVVSIGGGFEVHLVAMLGNRQEHRKNHRPCFWGFLVKEGQFSACLKMLNLRCLAVVFDLDETLFVANTMKSFEDKIGVLRQRLAANSDPQLAKLLAAELGRYEEDRQILLQYYDTNAVMLDGKCYVAQPEAVTPVEGQSLPATRPVLRLPHQNIAVSGESVRIQDESPAISPPGFGPPGFTTLGSRAQTRDPPLISSPSKKAVPASMKRVSS
ncbi:unnamed protein product [Closterium sp. NIES-65]|nr:unnamed protein product [Closterium sp. NIES-65]